MKKIIPLLFISTIGLAQPTFIDFRIEDQQLIYQHVFDTAVSINSAKEFFVTHPVIKNVQVVSDYLVGDFNNITIDYRKYGRKWGNTPILFTNNTFSGKMKIELKPGKYRLTVFAVTYAPMGSVSNNNGTELSMSALKRDKKTIKPGWATDPMLGLINDYFSDVFPIKHVHSDW